MTAGGSGSLSRFLRFFPCTFGGGLTASFGGGSAGKGIGCAAGEGKDEGGDNEVTSIEGDAWRVVEGELGEGESSGAGGGGRTK